MDWAINNGYIAINGKRVINTTSTAYAGFNLVELNVSSCSPSNILHFNTHASTTDSNNMATYINGLPLNTVLIGITADATTQNARESLFSIGVDLTGLDYYGKLIFVSQIGQPDMSVSRIESGGGNNLKMTVNVTGIGKSSV
jgi:Interleukin-like EMT inducer